MRYDILLLDLDGTILDFKTSQKRTFFRCFPGADEDFYQHYERINKSEWARLERGEATREEILHARFARFFEERGIKDDSDRMNEQYLSFLAEGCDTIPDAIEAVEILAQKCTLALVTNGVASVQRNRLTESGLKKYFKTVLVSEEIGFAKPDPRFFELAMEQCGAADKSKVLMIGDSLSADIAGGAAAGIDTCWFNPEGLPLPEGYSPTYIVKAPMDFISVAQSGAKGLKSL